MDTGLWIMYLLDMLNLIKITLLIFFTSPASFANDFSYSGLSERYFPELSYSDIDTSDNSPIFTANFAEIFNDFGKRPLTLNGKKVFGDKRPLNEEQFLELRDQMNSEGVSYREYVHQWIVENISPNYFRGVLDIEAQNQEIKKEIINKIFFQIISQITFEGGNNSYDTIKVIRSFVREKLIIQIKQEILMSSLREFKAKDYGKISRPLVIDFSAVLRQAKNPDISDEIFYQTWMNHTSQSIKEFLRFSRRVLVVENELQKQMQIDPMFMITRHKGDEELIYSNMISGERNRLKRANYKTEVLKVKIKDHDLVWFKNIIKKYSQINEIDLLVREFKIRKITVERSLVEKFGNNNIQLNDNLFNHEIKGLWNPLRLMQNQIAAVAGTNDLEYYIAGEVFSIGVYTFPIDSKFAKEEIRKELQDRKQKILYKRIVHRLGRKHPLMINFASCYQGITFCFPSNVHSLVLSELVKVKKSSEQREYLNTIDSSLFEQSIY